LNKELSNLFDENFQSPRLVLSDSSLDSRQKCCSPKKILSPKQIFHRKKPKKIQKIDKYEDGNHLTADEQEIEPPNKITNCFKKLISPKKYLKQTIESEIDDLKSESSLSTSLGM
jgi:hypothetical protein